jgi:hypothetical protein
VNRKKSSRRTYPKAGGKNKAVPRVAEPATAIYSVAKPSPLRKSLQTMAARQIAGYSVSDDVWQFAVANDLIPHLETAIRLVRACFPTVREIDFAYVIDPEIENNDWIDVAIKVSGTVDEILAQMNRFDDEMIKQVPIEKGAKICLGIRAYENKLKA